MQTNKVDEQIDLQITNQLYLHSSTAIYSTILNTIIVFFVFQKIASPFTLYAWCSITIVFLLIRLVFCRYVLKQGITAKNLRSRLNAFSVTICLSGIIFGSAGVLFLSHDYPAYNSFIFFLMGGTFAGSAGAFAIKPRVFYAFSTPVILPVTLYSFILGGKINMAMSLMGIIFILMMLVVVRRMNIPITEALTLSIENKNLAEKTRTLNEQLKISNENFKMQSFKDTMLNVFNRRYVTETLNPEVERFAFNRQRLADSDEPQHSAELGLIYGIYIIDIDYFKDVNDTWGHKCGDEMLIQFAHLIQSLIRRDDTLCRWGGEEFVVILKRTNPDYIQAFAKKLIATVEATPFKINDTTSINKTCSLGYAQFPFFEHLPLSISLDQTIEIADQALYYAKEHGRNKAVLAEYNHALNAINDVEETRRMMKDISHALAVKKIKFSEC